MKSTKLFEKILIFIICVTHLLDVIAEVRSLTGVPEIVIYRRRANVYR